VRRPEFVTVTTQAELDRVTAAGDVAVVRSGYFRAYGSATVEASDSATVEASDSATVRAYGSATVEAYDSATVRAYGSATVRAYDSATVEAYGSATVEAYDSATVRAYGSATVRAYGSATVRASGSATVRASGSATVRAYDSATVRASSSATVRAYDSATVRAYGSATVRASKYVATHDHGPRTTVRGGVIIPVPRLVTAAEWCEFYGVSVTDGVATLFKAVRDNWHSRNGADYSPGATPEAADWDGGKAECGGGLHFSPRPWEAQRFDDRATRYVACPVAVDSIVVHPDGAYPGKVKAPRVVAPGCIEVDIDGTPVAQTADVA
jgi:hypothetical protein